MDVRQTRVYYSDIDHSEICDCAYCQNYTKEVRATYPELAEYLDSIGVDIEKPFDSSPLEPDDTGHIEYASVLYIVLGSADDFVERVIDKVNIRIAEMHPTTMIDYPHFVIEVSPIYLKWTEREED